MEETEVAEEQAAATPIFTIYRRGYDPEQVDRYVLDQQRRLDEAAHRASESERKLAAAVGQLRELHRRVAVYESEARSAQPPQLDTLGERVQRILQEAWEGAYNLRQDAERDVNEMREQAQREVEALRETVGGEVEQLREVASKEAADVVDEATRRALHIRDETERRRQAYLERVERDREQAISQITYLYDQRQCAIAELARLQAAVQTTIEEMVRSPLGRPAPGVMDAVVDSAAARKAPGQGEGVQAPQLPGMEAGASVDVMDVGVAEMERYVRDGDLESARTARRSPVSDQAEKLERLMQSTEPPPPATGATPANEPPAPGIRRTVLPESAGFGMGRAEAAPLAGRASRPEARLGTRQDTRREAAGSPQGPGYQQDALARDPFADRGSRERTPEPPVAGAGPVSEVRRMDPPEAGGQERGAGSGAVGTVIPRPDRQDEFAGLRSHAGAAGPVGPRGVVGAPPESRSPVAGVAHSVQAGIEAAKGKLRRPRPQGVYDAEQEGWSE
ncbi:MAG: hypothetical protein ACRD0Z_02490 [Acidimicrobiales bacterium]